MFIDKTERNNCVRACVCVRVLFVVKSRSCVLVCHLIVFVCVTLFPSVLRSERSEYKSWHECCLCVACKFFVVSKLGMQVF